MSGERLLPCPFCGGKAKLSVGDAPPNEGGFYVECVDCKACTIIFFPVKEPVERQVCEAWNRRTPRTDGEAERLILPSRLETARLYEEYSRICIRSADGKLLWSESQPCGPTLGEILRYANKTEDSHT